LFALFEKLLNPFPDDTPTVPPRSFVAFMWACTRGLRHYMLWMTLCTAVIGAFEALLFAFLGTIVDGLAKASPTQLWADEGHKLLWLGGVLAASVALIAVQSLLKQQTLAGNFPMLLRWNFHRLMLAQSMHFYQDEFAGRIATKVMQTALAVRDAWIILAELMVFVVIYFVTIMAMLGGFDLWLLLPFTAWLALYGVALWAFVPKLGKVAKAQADARSLMTGRITDAYTNIATVKLFSHARREASFARSAMQEFLTTVQKQMRLVTAFEIVNHALSMALIASTAIVGPIIPPSIIMIIYALTDNSVTVTGLFLAGIVPGLLISLSLAVVNHWISVKRNYRSAAEDLETGPFLQLFLRALPALVLPVIILGGIQSGVFTPTEAAAAAVLYALLVGRFVYGTLTLDMLPAILYRTALMTASIMFIIATSAVFAWVLTVGQIPQAVAGWIAGMHLSPVVLLLAINVLLLLVGIFIEPLPGVMIMVPILAPLADAAGLNPLHFAIVVIVNLTLGMITPPVGGLLFVTSIVSGVPMGRMVREAVPMLVAMLIVLALLTFVPGLSTWLPGLLGYRN